VGIDVEFCSPLIVSNIIAGNSQKTGCSGDNGAGILVNGAAAAEIVHNVITNNSTTGNGGGIELFASGTPIIRENLIGWNTGARGGGIDIANYGDATIVNNLIVSNTATTGGGVYVLVPSGRRGPYIINNTIASNLGTTGSGVYSDGYDKDALLANNIIVAFGSQTALYIGNFNDTNQPVIRYNDLFSPSGLAFGGLGANPVGLNGNISLDPLFLNPALKNYHLRSNSPVIDAALNSDAPTNDLDYVARPYDGDANGVSQADMGAFEWNPIRARLFSLGVGGGQSPVLTWTSSGGVRYRVQYSDGNGLGGFAGVFTDLPRSATDETDPGPAGLVSVMTFSDTNAVSGLRSRFYRIKTVSQP
jgi:parallel beta-helix repeat protein